MVVSINEELSSSKIPPLVDIFFTDIIWVFELTKERGESVDCEEFSVTKLETAGSQVRQYKIFFTPQSDDGMVVVKRVSFWENIGRVPYNLQNAS